MKDINSTLTFSLIFVLISVGILFFLFKPAYQKFSLDKIELKESQTELKYRQDYVRQVSDTIKRLEKDKDSIAKLNFSLPENVSLSSLFNFLQAAAQKNGLILTDITMPTKTPLVLQKKVVGKGGKKVILKQKTNLDYYSFSIQVQGPYDHFKGFVSDLEKSARMIEIDNINFSAPLKLSTSTSFFYNLDLKTYSFHK